LSKREIIPDLKKNAWLDMDGTRFAGLATNLRQLGIPNDVIQRILRHSDVTTTQRHYAKTLPAPVRKAMSRLNRSLTADKQRAVKRNAL